jgi:hypothetical protein
MKTLTLLQLVSSFLLITSSDAHAAEDAPVPPEVQTLVESLVTAIKSADDAALIACWHTPVALGKVKQAEEAAEAAAEGKTLSAEDLAEEAEDEVEDRTEENEDTVERAARFRQFVTKHFGELSALTLLSVDIDVDDEAPSERPAYDDVDFILKAADGTQLSFGANDLVKIDGVWKFVGRLDDDIKIELPKKQ